MLHTGSFDPRHTTRSFDPDPCCGALIQGCYDLHVSCLSLPFGHTYSQLEIKGTYGVLLYLESSSFEISTSIVCRRQYTMDSEYALMALQLHIDRSPPHLNTRSHTATRRAACAPQVPPNDMWGHPEVATLTTVWVEELQKELSITAV